MDVSSTEALRPPRLEGVLPTLQAERLMLRNLAESDLDALLTIWGDEAVMRFMARPPMKTRQEARAFLAGIEGGLSSLRLFQWGVVFGEEGVIGTVTLLNIDWQHRRAEVGFALARSHWRRGVMREAVTSVLNYAFDSLRLHRIEADVDPRNEASVALLRGLGFVIEGRLRQRYFDRGEIQDADWYGLLAPDWSAQRATRKVTRRATGAGTISDR